MILLWLACTPEPVSLAFVEGFSYRWTRFNHRVSAVRASPESVFVVGGTSTTGVSPDLADSCDASSCQEFPFIDTSEVTVRRAEISSDSAHLAVESAEVTLEAGAEPVTSEVRFDVSGRGTAVAFLTALELDTDHPLDGAATCYDPAFGWLPTRIHVTLGAPRETGDGVVVSVTAAFEAGNTLETGRGCVDASRAGAVVSIRARVAVAITPGEVDQIFLAFNERYDLGTSSDPDAQPDPTPAERPLEAPFPDAVWGWTSLDWRFHVDDPSRRGAYLRSLSFVADTEAGLLSAHASNYSPPTQLSGFDYDFTGAVTAFTVPGAAVRRETLVSTIPAELDENGDPTPHQTEFF